MDLPDRYKNIRLDEAERKPNIFATNALLLIMASFLIAELMNEIGIFKLPLLTMRLVSIGSIIMTALAHFISRDEKKICDPRTKYFIMFIILTECLWISTLLTLNGTLLMILPLIIITQYHSKELTYLTIIGCSLICIVAPIFAYLLGTWDINYMIGLFETVTRRSIVELGDSTMSRSFAIGQILLFYSLPQMMFVVTYGLILTRTTVNNIRGLDNHMKLIRLNDSLNQELEEDKLDPLTGAVLRNTFIERCELIINAGKDGAFLMIDVDDFKYINDHFGHLGGDKVLQEVVRAAQKTFRSKDVICRMGGDEFAVLLVDINKPSAISEAISRFKKNIADIRLEEEPEFEVHVSMGVKVFNHDDPVNDFRQLYGEADQALYDAKSSGKNQVCFVGEEITQQG